MILWSLRHREMRNREKRSYVVLWLKMNICFNQWDTLSVLFTFVDKSICTFYEIGYSYAYCILQSIHWHFIKNALSWLLSWEVISSELQLFHTLSYRISCWYNIPHVTSLSLLQTGNSINLIRLLSVKAFSKHHWYKC